MAGRGVVILTIGLLALVLLVMPSAVARFSGQHVFLAGSSVNCSDCHQQEHYELYQDTSTNAHEGMNCTDCHVPSFGALNNPYGPTDANQTAPYHAAALIECLYCHGAWGNGTQVESGAVIPNVNVTEEFENSAWEAHIPLYNASRDDYNYLKKANEACIACHTQGAKVYVNTTRKLNVSALYIECTPGQVDNCYDGWQINITTVSSG